MAGYLYSGMMHLSPNIFLENLLSSPHVFLICYYFPESSLFLPVSYLLFPASAHWPEAFLLIGDSSIHYVKIRSTSELGKFNYEVAQSRQKNNQSLY